jgi:hypothetical protein
MFIINKINNNWKNIMIKYFNNILINHNHNKKPLLLKNNFNKLKHFINMK